MSARKITFKHRLEYMALYGFFLASRRLPRRSLVRMGERLGRVVFDRLKIRRHVAMENLRMAFADKKSRSELTDVARSSYEQLAGSMLEFISLYSIQERELIDDVTIEQLDRIVAAKVGGRGAVLVTGHFGSWELFGAAFVANGHPVTFLVKEQSNLLASRLQNLLRAKGGIGIVKQGPKTVRRVMQALDEGQLVGILPDQDAGTNGVFVDFLGKPASTFKGPAFFAYKANVPIVAAYIRRLPDGSHHAVVEPPIWPDPLRDRDDEIQRLTDAYTRDMERWVLRYPEHYFWLHRRWKTQPLAAGGPRSRG